MAEAKEAPPQGQPEDNETRKQIAGAAARGTKGVRLDTNRAFLSLDAVLEEATVGHVTISYVAGDDTTQGNGVVGGGTLANMLDCTLAAAVMSALGPGKVPTTISLTVNMLRPGAPGRVVATANVERLGRTIAFANASLANSDGAVLATATSSLAIINL